MNALTRSYSYESIFLARQPSFEKDAESKTADRVNRLGLQTTLEAATTSAALKLPVRTEIVRGESAEASVQRAETVVGQEQQDQQIQQELPVNTPARRLPPCPEDSIWRKLLTCVPLVGIYPLIKNFASLGDKINGNRNDEEVANYAKIRNHYHGTSIVNTVLTAAIIVSIVALTLLAPPVGLVAGFFGVSIIGGVALGCGVGLYTDFNAISKNQQFINNVKNGTPITDRRIW